VDQLTFTLYVTSRENQLCEYRNYVCIIISINNVQLTYLNSLLIMHLLGTRQLGN